MRVSTASWACLTMMLAASAHAQSYRDDIGYDDLVDRLGAAVPTGAGVTVMQVEAPTGTDSSNLPIWSPTLGTSSSVFTGVTFDFVTGSSGRSPSTSGHAIGVGNLFYGNSALASGISAVQLGSASDWLQADFLGVGTAAAPSITTARVINHSWVGAMAAASANAGALRRTDWLVQRDNVINVVAMNGGSTN